MDPFPQSTQRVLGTGSFWMWHGFLATLYTSFGSLQLNRSDDITFTMKLLQVVGESPRYTISRVWG